MCHIQTTVLHYINVIRISVHTAVTFYMIPLYCYKEEENHWASRCYFKRDLKKSLWDNIYSYESRPLYNTNVYFYILIRFKIFKIQQFGIYLPHVCAVKFLGWHTPEDWLQVHLPTNQNPELLIIKCMFLELKTTAFCFP